MYSKETSYRMMFKINVLDYGCTASLNSICDDTSSCKSSCSVHTLYHCILDIYICIALKQVVYDAANNVFEYGSTQIFIPIDCT